MVTIKKVPSDFKVKELINLAYSPGRYSYFLLFKRNYDTIKAIELISKKLKIPLKNFGFAGNKDKYAETKQAISILNCNKNKIEALNLKDIKLTFLGTGKKRINLANNIGNSFEIKIYNFKKYHPSNFFINYFGEQRFGKENISIGKKILKKEKVNLDIKRKRFCLSAYQSYLWNKCINIYLKNQPNTFKVNDYIFLKKKIKNIKIPLINFDTELKGEIGDIYTRLLKQEKITQKDFIIKQEPRLITETVYKNLIVNVGKVSFKNNILKFELPKGSYATVFIRKLFKEDIH
ncbi:MAG: tRNA pseudouridine(13) synthase TruD [Candidatus Woesearchaeota archaeon]